MDNFPSILASVLSSAVAIAAIWVNRRDKLVDKISELGQRISRIEAKLDMVNPVDLGERLARIEVKIEGLHPTPSRGGPAASDDVRELRAVDTQ